MKSFVYREAIPHSCVVYCKHDGEPKKRQSIIHPRLTWVGVRSLLLHMLTTRPDSLYTYTQNQRKSTARLGAFAVEVFALVSNTFVSASPPQSFQANRIPSAKLLSMQPLAGIFVQVYIWCGLPKLPPPYHGALFVRPLASPGP